MLIKYRFEIGIIYRKPNTDIKQFHNSLLGALEHLKVGRSNIVLIGDLNIELMQSDTCTFVYDYLSSLECLGMQQIIKDPTRMTKTTSSLIDHIYTNIRAFTIHTGVTATDPTDHFPIFVGFQHNSLSKMNPQTSKKSTRSYKGYKADLFCEDLAKTNWHTVCEQNNVDTAYNLFHDIFKCACDKH